jgi:CheY-like chemotaxis protein
VIAVGPRRNPCDTDDSVRLVHHTGAVSAEPAPRPLRILLVDDDEFVSEALTLLLRRDGHEVAYANSGQDALEHLATNPELDLVLTDLGMPDVNGWEVARTAKTKRPSMPVVLVTGWGDDEELAHAVTRGAVDFVLTKPFDRMTLSAALARVTGPLAA